MTLNDTQQIDAFSRELSHLKAILHATTDDNEWCRLSARFAVLFRAYIRLVERAARTASTA
jgi:hypothetical protein